MNLLNFHWFYGKTLKSEKELLLQTLFLCQKKKMSETSGKIISLK